MFLHNLKYEILHTVRQKDTIFWMLCFPIILGTFFYLAFGNLYEKEEAFKSIPVAIVEEKSDAIFHYVTAELSTGEDAMLDATFTDREKAHEMLENGDVDCVIYVNEEISLGVTGSGISASIVQSFLKQYEIQKAVITDTAMNNPEKLGDVTKALSAEISCIDDDKITTGNMDAYVQYFFNLIAMVALLGSTNGLQAAVNNQGNLSAIGARKCISPTNKLKSTLASLLSAYIIQLFCVFISITYLLTVLRVNMGDKIGMIYLAGAVGALTGTAVGFLIGSVGRMKEAARVGFSISFTMACCFLSGLMVGQMKMIVAQQCPIINKINPAALISDLFYCLTIYDDYKRFTENIIILLIISALCTFAGFICTRRKKYASL